MTVCARQGPNNTVMKLMVLIPTLLLDQPRSGCWGVAWFCGTSRRLPYTSHRIQLQECPAFSVPFTFGLISSERKKRQKMRTRVKLGRVRVRQHLETNDANLAAWRKRSAVVSRPHACQ
eukprot:4998900-Amphidinium_carterae.1